MQLSPTGWRHNASSKKYNRSTWTSIRAKNTVLSVPLSSGFSSSVCGSVGEAAFTGVVDSGVSKAPSESELLRKHKETRLLWGGLKGTLKPLEAKPGRWCWREQHHGTKEMFLRQSSGHYPVQISYRRATKAWTIVSLRWTCFHFLFPVDFIATNENDEPAVWWR